MAQNDFDLTVMQREILDVIEPAIVGLSSELSAYGHSGNLSVECSARLRGLQSREFYSNAVTP